MREVRASDGTRALYNERLTGDYTTQAAAWKAGATIMDREGLGLVSYDAGRGADRLPSREPPPSHRTQRHQGQQNPCPCGTR